MYSLSPIHLLYWTRAVGRPNHARLARWRAAAERIIARAKELKNLNDPELLRLGREIRWRSRTDVPLVSLAEEAYALVREASRRTVGMEHFPVQLMGGLALLEGHITEMQTGEGKTLTAVLPAYIRALAGKGCHVITVNDYLAGRDAQIMGPIYEKLGLSVGCIQTPMEPDERREAYRKDITYGTAKEMGFDFLRDRLRLGAGKRTDERRRPFGTSDGQDTGTVQRGHHFALIDEADSILIDEARTPLIIGLTMPNDASTVNLLRWCCRTAAKLSPGGDFVYEPDRRSAYLTDAGCRKVLLASKPSLLNTIDTERIYTNMEQALTARYAFHLDKDYVVVDDEVVIVDESTGRMMEGRKWQDGLHQAVEAKELVPITAATGQAARITVQSYFRQYSYLAGMTGTASHARRELRKTYHLKVAVIPTNRPCIRVGWPPRIFATQEAKRRAVVGEIEELIQTGRSILVGTPSVDASEALGEMLKEHRIAHQILNARYHDQEAQIVAQAGQPRKVTIATNMAGRGTDIILEPSVREAGGLHVIATEMHSSARIDRQLVGRAARQGDPGSYRFFLSLEDELLRNLEHNVVEHLRRQAGAGRDGELSSRWLELFRKTQAFLERTHGKQRRDLLRQEKTRLTQYRQMGLDPYLELTD